MVAGVDGRGSVPQVILYKLTQSIYPNYNIVYEQAIPDLNQRYDIFISELGIAIEYDGEQHFAYNEFFHGTASNYMEAKMLDTKKGRFSEENGIKIVRFRGDMSEMTTVELKKAIDVVPYPDAIFSASCLVGTNLRLERDRKYRQSSYQYMKQRNKNN